VTCKTCNRQAAPERRVAEVLAGRASYTSYNQMCRESGGKRRRREEPAWRARKLMAPVPVTCEANALVRSIWATGHCICGAAGVSTCSWLTPDAYQLRLLSCIGWLICSAMSAAISSGVVRVAPVS